jgi:hypothetical protein
MQLSFQKVAEDIDQRYKERMSLESFHKAVLQGLFPGA